MTHLSTRRNPAERFEMPGLQMKYFVLKPKGDDPYARASRAAMHHYAKFIEQENPELAKELRDWAAIEGAEANFNDRT